MRKIDNTDIALRYSALETTDKRIGEKEALVNYFKGF